jgi:hypothetical protein
MKSFLAKFIIAATLIMVALTVSLGGLNHLRVTRLFMSPGQKDNLLYFYIPDYKVSFGYKNEIGFYLGSNPNRLLLWTLSGIRVIKTDNRTLYTVLDNCSNQLRTQMISLASPQQLSLRLPQNEWAKLIPRGLSVQVIIDTATNTVQSVYAAKPDLLTSISGESTICPH